MYLTLLYSNTEISESSFSNDSPYSLEIRSETEIEENMNYLEQRLSKIFSPEVMHILFSLSLHYSSEL